MTTYPNLNTPTPAYVLVPVLCHDCGALGTVYADDHVTLVCGRCALVRKGVAPND